MSKKKRNLLLGVMGVITAIVFLMTLIVVLVAVKNGDKVGASAGVEDNEAGDNNDGNNGGNNNVDDTNKDDMTIIVYMIGSNLERDNGYVSRDIQQMIDVAFDDNINIIIQAGGCSNWNNDILSDGDTHRLYIEDGQLYEIENMGRTDMTEEDTLSDFIEYATTNCPAKKYTLLMWNHGGGVPMGYGSDDMFPGETMTDAELKVALEQADVQFETIIFNACLMSTLEVSMAVKDYADYMVAAESTILGGLIYNNWLAYIKEHPDASATEHCEVLMSDYMDFIRSYKLISCISMIDLDKVDEVHDAYAKYAESVYEQIINKGYETYYKLRGDCGFYDGSDSVDLITLASTYETSDSQALIDAVEAAVLYSDSGYLYGHGLAAYSPHNQVGSYDDGRESLEMLGYDEAILDYYDAYCSIYLEYDGDAYVSNYDWYDVAAVEGQVGSDTNIEPGTYPLATIQKDGYEAVRLTDAEWEVVDSVGVCVLLQDENSNYLMLGQNSYYVFDEVGDLIVGLPDAWAYLNGAPVCYICVDEYEDEQTGAWSEYGTIMAKRNGEEILMLVYYSEEYSSGTILGYMNYDFETQVGERYVYQFKDDDVIELIHPVINADTAKITYDNVLGGSVYASELVLTYDSISFEGYTTLSYIEITDIYGNEYRTDERIYQ